MLNCLPLTPMCLQLPVRLLGTDGVMKERHSSLPGRRNFCWSVMVSRDVEWERKIYFLVSVFPGSSCLMFQCDPGKPAIFSLALGCRAWNCVMLLRPACLYSLRISLEANVIFLIQMGSLKPNKPSLKTTHFCLITPKKAEAIGTHKIHKLEANSENCICHK